MTNEERMDLLEFQTGLLYELYKNRNSDAPDFNALLFEHNITKQQAHEILNVVEDHKNKINRNEAVSRGDYERAIYRTVPTEDGNGPFAEAVVEYLAAKGQFEEVYQNLYQLETR